MLFSLRSMAWFSLAITASVLLPPLVPVAPVVMPGWVLAPDDCAVPALLVPGAGGEATWAELPAPVEPAFGEPTALPPPPALWAREMPDEARIATAVITAVTDVLAIEVSFTEQPPQEELVPPPNDFE